MKSSSRRAFTLVELLTVIAIIAVLTAITIPVINNVRESARNTRCMVNLRGLHTAASLWSTENGGRLPDARRWAYNEGASNTSHQYQLSNYLVMTAPKGAAWGDAPSPMKCDSAAAIRLSTQEWGRTYSINAYATSTLDGVLRQEIHGYPLRMSLIPHPAKMAFFMDGAVSPATGAYQTNVSGSHASPGHSTPFNYPHGDSINVVFIDGHVESIDRAVMVSAHSNTGTSFWRFDR